MSGSAQAYRFTFTHAERPVRLILNGIVVAESARAMVMRETRLPPVFYFPLDDVWLGLVTQTDHRTYCPFKGNASFYTNELKVIEYGQSRQSNELSESPQYANLLVGWLMRDAPEAKSGRELTAQLAERLLANGVPLWRLAVVIRTLHPQVVSFAYRWRLDSPDIHESQSNFLVLETLEFLKSPLLPIFEGTGGIRRRLEGSDPILDFGILEDLRREGATDYVAMPMTFSAANINALTVAPDRPGGFTTTDLGRLYEILSNLGRLFEVPATR